jgi:single-strand DNA-binding protein
MAPRIKHSVTGNLVGDPVEHLLDGGKTILSFRIAENTRKFDRESQSWQDGPTTFYDVGMNESVHSRNVKATLSRGMRVDVVGDYDAKPFVTKDGQAGLNHRIFAEKVAPSLEFATAEVTANVKPSPAPSQDNADLSPEQLQKRQEADAAWGITA